MEHKQQQVPSEQHPQTHCLKFRMRIKKARKFGERNAGESTEKLTVEWNKQRKKNVYWEIYMKLFAFGVDKTMLRKRFHAHKRTEITYWNWVCDLAANIIQYMA